MDINKAIRKQKKSNIRFLLFLGFIFFILPLILFLSNMLKIFFLIYLGIIELLILITILININNSYLRYSSDDYRIKIKVKWLSEELNIVCDKVRLVHTEGKAQQMTIILVMSSKFRNKKIKPIDESFLRFHPYLAQNYYRTKKQNLEENYFYISITKGGYEKYKLLDLIYRNCVKAQYTEETVEKIKEYRKIQ
jgi:K+ transporter